MAVMPLSSGSGIFLFFSSGHTSEAGHLLVSPLFPQLALYVALPILFYVIKRHMGIHILSVSLTDEGLCSLQVGGKFVTIRLVQSSLNLFQSFVLGENEYFLISALFLDQCCIAASGYTALFQSEEDTSINILVTIQYLRHWYLIPS